MAEDVLRRRHRTADDLRFLKLRRSYRSRPMRRIVGERMTQSKLSAPHFYISMDIDMSAVGKLRSEWKSRGDEMVPSINDFILHACAARAQRFPVDQFKLTRSRELSSHSEINIGMAVALDEGLVVPVIRNADRLIVD